MERPALSSKLHEISQILDAELMHCPTKDQKQLKAAFWTLWADNPFVSPERITLADVKQVTQSNEVGRWWGDEQFRSWFLNQNEFRQKLEYLAHRALDVAEEILETDITDKNMNAKVQMIKLIAELANKVPQRWVKEKIIDAEIQKMDPAQLESYIQKQMKLLTSGSEPPKEASGEEEGKE